MNLADISQITWEQIDTQFKQHIPKLREVWNTPKYIAPVRPELYPNWQHISLGEIGINTHGKVIWENDHNTISTEQSQYLLHLKLRSKGAIIYVEPELARALLETDAPEDIPTSDINWAYEAVKLILPKGTFTLDGKNVSSINGGLLKDGESVISPKEFENTEYYDSTQYVHNKTVMTWDVIFDVPYGESLHAYKAWDNKLIKDFHSLNSDPHETSEDEKQLLSSCGKFLLNTILLLQAKPEYLGSSKLLRKPNIRKNVSELREGRLLGNLLVQRKSGNNNGNSCGTIQAPQVRKGHWKMQPYGKNNALRKLLWIHPYLTKVAG